MRKEFQVLSCSSRFLSVFLLPSFLPFRFLPYVLLHFFLPAYGHAHGQSSINPCRIPPLLRTCSFPCFLLFILCSPFSFLSFLSCLPFCLPLRVSSFLISVLHSQQEQLRAATKQMEVTAPDPLACSPHTCAANGATVAMRMNGWSISTGVPRERTQNRERHIARDSRKGRRERERRKEKKEGEKRREKQRNHAQENVAETKKALRSALHAISIQQWHTRIYM